MTKTSLFVFAISAACISPICNAASIATIFDSDLFLIAGGGAIFFDITTGPNPVTVTGLSSNFGRWTRPGDDSGTSFSGFDVWLLEGSSYAGSELNPAGWTAVTAGSGTTASLNQKTEVVLNSSFTLDANRTYGVMLSVPQNVWIAYTRGDGSNQVYSNSDLTLTLGAVTDGAFSGIVRSARVWNGELTYTVPEPDGVVVLAGGIMSAMAMKRRRCNA
jgi:hypothetical protein